MQQLASNLFIIGGGQSAAILQLTGWRDQTFGAQSVWQAKSDSFEHVRWGPGDNMPNVMRKLIEKNNQVRPELTTLRDLIYGSGGCWKQVDPESGLITPFYDKALRQWEKDTKLAKYEIASINQYIDNANIFTRYEWDIHKNIPKLSISDSFNTRIGKPQTLKKGVVQYLTNPYFGEMQLFSNEETDHINAFDAEELSTDLVQILHSKEDIPGNPFYSFPSWWGSVDWIELANLIPLFHKHGIQNGYNIKYLIKMPKDYFDADGKKMDEKESKEKWGALEENLRNMLSGKENVNKTMLIKYLRGQDGKMMDNIDVIPLKNEMSDDAYSKILEMANLSIANSIGLLPTLAGVNPGKGNDSGSQIRVMADFQQAFRTVVPRTIITEAVNEAVWLLDPKYENIFRWYDGISLTTLDVSKEGKEEVSNVDHKNKLKDDSE